MLAQTRVLINTSPGQTFLLVAAVFERYRLPSETVGLIQRSFMLHQKNFLSF